MPGKISSGINSDNGTKTNLRNNAPGWGIISWSVSINELQTKVWGHNLKLETHTVETHIYRLRKKISNKFKNDDFIQSTKLGYNIKWKKEI